MKQRILLLASAFVLLGIFFAGTNGTMEITDNNGKAGFTGSPGESTCNSGGCHNSFGLNSGPGSITITHDIPAEGYTPGTVYNITVTVAQQGVSLFGVGFEALTSGNVNAGTLTATNSSVQIKTAANGRKNIVHTLGGGASANSKAFQFTWTAPAAGTGNVTFYGIGNAANGNNSTSGDYIYNTNQSVSESNGVGIEYISSIETLRIYPNPVANELQLEFTLNESKRVNINIADIEGRNVMALYNQNESAGTINKTFDISSLSTGVYLLIIQDGSTKKVQRILVNR